MTTRQPNGPRPEKTTGRLRHTLKNLASKQDVEQAQRPGEASYGRNTRPKRKTTEFQSGQRLQKLAQNTATAPAPRVQTAQPAQSSTAPLVAFASLATALSSLKGGGSGGGGTALGGDPQANIQLAKSLAKQEYGWTNEQWRALKQLGMRESGWRTDAANPNSTARGIPQAMMSIHFGEDWQNSPEAKKFLRNPKLQIEWMLQYIKGRYGDPQAALRFHNKNNYY